MSTITDRQTRLSQRAARTQEPPISWLMRKPLEDPEIISLAAGFVDQQSLPYEEVRDVLNSIFASKDTGKNSLQYGSTIGYGKLRKLLAQRLESQGLAAPVNPDHIVMTSGSQQLLFLISDVLVDPGDIVLVEDPTYFVYLGVLEAVGARAIGVATDGDGMIPEALEQRLEELKAADLLPRLKILYLMTYYQNPKGTSIPWKRREKILELVQRFSTPDNFFYVLEDAAYLDLRYDGPEIPLMKTLDPDNERILLALTFSKGFSPGLRLGYGHLPEELVEPVLNQKGNHDFGSSNLAQYIAHNALVSGYFDEHGKKLRDRYRRKRDLMLKVIREEFPKEVSYISPLGGLYVWATLPDGVSTTPGTRFFDEAMKRKVL
ncbi:MAG: PLP-dependent aminotransferase family protein, partial [bacterium]